jgi:hypothetical protein
VSDELAGVLGGSDHALVEILSLHLTMRNGSNSKFWVSANRRHKKYRSIVSCLIHPHVVRVPTHSCGFVGANDGALGAVMNLHGWKWEEGIDNWKAISF